MYKSSGEEGTEGRLKEEPVEEGNASVHKARPLIT